MEVESTATCSSAKTLLLASVFLPAKRCQPGSYGGWLQCWGSGGVLRLKSGPCPDLARVEKCDLGFIIYQTTSKSSSFYGVKLDVLFPSIQCFNKLVGTAPLLLSDLGGDVACSSFINAAKPVNVNEQKSRILGIVALSDEYARCPSFHVTFLQFEFGRTTGIVQRLHHVYQPEPLSVLVCHWHAQSPVNS